MGIQISAACGCHIGKRRSNNEDNLLFDSRCLDVDHIGLDDYWIVDRIAKQRELFAVFDGMGGESYGEYASFAAASYVQNKKMRFRDRLSSLEDYLERLCKEANVAVVQKANELKASHMGTTMVGLLIAGDNSAVCNVGDSRAYRIRSNQMEQLSIDHVGKMRPGQSGKAPLTQHLGIDPEVLLIEPHIASFELKENDKFILCSDGLTDMVEENVILDIAGSANTPEECVQSLISEALENGGRDNITVIAVFI